MRTQANKIFKTIAVFLLLVILLVSSKSIANPYRPGLLNIFAPLLKALHSSSAALKRLIPFASLGEETRLLRERINLLSRRLDEARLVHEENTRLKALLNFRQSVPYRTVPACVIGRDPTNWSNSLIIDKGLANGVSRNKAVIQAAGLVGKVAETGRYSSKALLITDPSSRVGVLIERTRDGGILIGRAGSRCKMIYIALDSDVKAGDRVITAGFGSIFPKDILVGEVESVGRETGRLYKYAVVKTAANLSKAEEVLCIR